MQPVSLLDYRHAGDEGVHHAGVPASGEDDRGSFEPHERGELASGGNQVQKERRVSGCHREGESAGGSRWHCVGQRDRGHHRDEGVSLRHARTEAGSASVGGVMSRTE